VGFPITINHSNQQIKFSRANNVLQTKVFDLDANDNPSNQPVATIDNSNIYVDMYSTSQKTQAFEKRRNIWKEAREIYTDRCNVSKNIEKLQDTKSTTLRKIGAVRKERWKIPFEIKKAEQNKQSNKVNQLINQDWELFYKENALLVDVRNLSNQISKLNADAKKLHLKELKLVKSAEKLMNDARGQNRLSQLSVIQQDNILTCLDNGTRKITDVENNNNNSAISGFTIQDPS